MPVTFAFLPWGRFASAPNQLKRLRSFSRKSKPTQSERLKSTGSKALTMLNFVGRADGEARWIAVEARFVEITATTDGLLPRSKFGECIGMNSGDFASVLFDALARRYRINGDVINQEQLREFYEHISDQNFDSSLKTFFDMIDKDNDGRITEDQVREIIELSFSANNLLTIRNRADEYAALLMEELDPDNIGYILIESLECLLMEAETQYKSTNIEDRKILSRMLSVKLKTRRDPTSLERWYMKMTWVDLAKPIAFGAYERLIQTFKFRINTVMILKVSILPEKVLNLQISKPRNFIYESGQYMLVNCPTVSSSEWHPFYITSGPQDDYLSIHVLSVGDWTEALVQLFVEMCKPPQVGDTLHDENNYEFPKIKIDGPYGTPAQDYKKYEVVLLVGIGIGVSPMISIIKDISKSYPEAKEDLKTRKAYFYWLTKEPGSYSWFQHIMNEVLERDIYRAINLYNYCTSVYEEGDVRSALIRMVQSLNHAKYGMDIISGTRVMTHFAKPNWKNVYKKIAVDHPSSHVGVFCCGEVTLAKELSDLALEFTHKTTTKFSFHKENFYPLC